MYLAEFCACIKFLDVLVVREYVVAYFYLMKTYENLAFLKYEKRIQNLFLYAGIRLAISSSVTAIFPCADVWAPTATS